MPVMFPEDGDDDLVLKLLVTYAIVAVAAAAVTFIGGIVWAMFQ